MWRKHAILWGPLRSGACRSQLWRNGDHGSCNQGAKKADSTGLSRCISASWGGKWDRPLASRSEKKYHDDLASGIRFRPPIASSMLGITDPKMSKWVQERSTPHPYSTYEDPPASGTPESASIPRTYIHCTLGYFSSWMEPFTARARKLKWNVFTMAAGHEVMITHPNELAEILLQIANK